MSWGAVIPEAPPSANVYLRLHYRDKTKLRLKWDMLLVEGFGRNRPTIAQGRRKVKVTVVSRQARDYGNLWTPVDKLLLDNLTRRRWIVDDSAEWLAIEIEGETGRRPETRVEIHDVEPA